MKKESPTNILMVEDSEELLQIWVRLFRTGSNGSQYKVRAYNRGTAALEAVASGFVPDVLITDYYLGDSNGLEIYQQITKSCPQTRTIIVTGNHDDVAIREHAKAGRIQLLVKPVRFGKLKQAVAEAVTR